MDSITQILLGATVGVAACGRTLGRRRSIVWGGVGGLLPDLDAIVAAPFDEFTRLAAHRGVSHALWFGAALGTILGYFSWRWSRRRDPSGAGSPRALRHWISLWALSIVTHPLLDLFTSYGTQLFAPFSRRRFVVEAIGIIDPVYSLVLLTAVVWAWRSRKGPDRTMRVARAALVISTAYVLSGVWLNRRAELEAKHQLAASGLHDAQVIAYATPLQLSLRRIVARTPDAVRIGYLAAFNPGPIHWWSFEPEKSELIEKLRATPEGRLFEWFAQHQTVGRTVAPTATAAFRRVEIDDIRYGMPSVPQEGFWGIAAEFDGTGRNVSPVRRISRPRNIEGYMIADLFRAALGHDPRTFRVGLPSLLPTAKIGRGGRIRTGDP